MSKHTGHSPSICSSSSQTPLFPPSISTIMAGDGWSSALVQIIPRLMPYGFLLLCCSVFGGGGGISSQGATVPFAAASSLCPPPLPSPVVANATHDATCLDSERGALLQLKAGLVDPNGRLSSWQLGALDCCRWRGVACDSRTGVVVKLDLRNPTLMQDGRSWSWSRSWSLSGRIDASLVHLRSLRHLDLSWNTFDGVPIPAFIGSFRELRYLDLSHAGFPGVIPPQLGNLTRLEYLDISYDDVSSVGFEWVSGLSSLRHLALNQVNLSTVGSDWFRLLNERLPFLVELQLSLCSLRGGSLVHSLNFSSLETIDLSGNSISSGMLTWLANVSSLVHVDMSYNSLYGPIPLGFSELPSLEFLDLSENENLTADVSQLLGRGGWPRLEIFSFRGTSLFGKIPSGLGNLTSLVELDLSSYNITGMVTEAHLSRLRNLQVLRLGYNSLTLNVSADWIPPFQQLRFLDVAYCGLGPAFPSWIKTQRDLLQLDISNNGISGEIPAGFWDLFFKTIQNLDMNSNFLGGNLPVLPHNLSSQLEILDFSANRFSGPIWPNIGERLPNLIRLSVAGNDLTGEIPATIGRMKHLSQLNLSENNLIGEIPATIGRMKNLWQLDLSKNNLTGEIPATIRRMILQWLDLSKNNLTGEIPATIGRMKILQWLDLSKNNLIGEIPATIGRMKNLSLLYLSKNNLTGEIPATIGGMIYLWMLDLSNNKLTGEIPATIGGMIYLGMLDLSKNNLTGEIPTTIGGLIGLQKLDLSKNNLIGQIPATIGRMIQLQVLDLSRNNLTGGIPMLARLKNLQALQVHGNMLLGEVPSSICGCLALETLDLGNNKLYGKIPICIEGLRALRVLRLRSNKFSGEIPSQVSNLSLLQVLDIAENNLTGPIPRQLESLTGMMHPERVQQSLVNSSQNSYELTSYLHWKGNDFDLVIKIDFLRTIIDLSGNKLSGDIPDSLMNLAGLVSLSLSRNLLTGRILERIGEMNKLQTLDLSNNCLSGEIPASMTSLHFLGSLNLSYNNFSGTIPVGGQMGTFIESSFYGNPYLCGPLFQPNCSRDSIQSLDINRDVETNVNGSLYFSMGLGFAFGLLVPFIILLVKRSWSTTYFKLVDLIVDKLF